MAWIYKDKEEQLMFSKTKPQKVYKFRTKNKDLPVRYDKKYFSWYDDNYVIEISIKEADFNSQGYYDLFDIGDDYLVKKYIKKNVLLKTIIMKDFLYNLKLKQFLL